jgi:hypothetical protein
VFDTILQAVDNDIAINSSYKNVCPIYGCETYKMKLLMIVEFVFSAHVAKPGMVV